MLTDHTQAATNPMRERTVLPSTYSPVRINLQETVGVVVLGVVALALLMALLRAEARQRELATRTSR